VTTKTATSVLEAHFAQQIAAAIEAAYFGNFDQLGKRIWAAHGAGHLTDDQATDLAAALQARRKSNRPPPTVGAALRVEKLMFKRSPTQRSPDRARSIARRRLLAASGPLPPALAANFTTSELAVLKIIADEVAAKGYCDLDVKQLAARAGGCETTARNAMRFAELDGLIKIVRRPRPGLRHLTNIVTIIRAEWKLWLRRHRARPSGNAAPLIPTPEVTGCKNVEATVSVSLLRDRAGVWRTSRTRESDRR
jgi:hypothetical protein